MKKHVIIFEEYLNNRITWTGTNGKTYLVFYGKKEDFDVQEEPGNTDSKMEYSILRVEDEDGHDVTHMLDTIITDQDGMMRMIKDRENDLLANKNDVYKDLGKPDALLQQSIALDGGFNTRA